MYTKYVSQWLIQIARRGVNLYKSSPNFTISQFYDVLKNLPNANLSIVEYVCDGSRNVPDIMPY